MTSSLTSLTNSNVATRLGLPDIAFVGKAGAGKSTAAELLAELGYRKLSFATPLKDLAAWLWDEDARTDRSKLQALGVGARAIDPDVWVNLLLKHLHGPLAVRLNQTGSQGERDPIAVDDCRFPNEWFALKAEGFVIVRMYAPPALRIDRLKANGKYQNDEQLEHSSETAVDDLDADYTILNDGTTADLYDEIVSVILRERKRR